MLDQSPGSYRWGDLETPVPGDDEIVFAPRASALNHMDLWVTKGKPVPPLPHVPGCDAAGIVTAVGSQVRDISVGDEVVINPGVSPQEDIDTWGLDSPLGPGFRIWGEHCNGSLGEFAVIPARNVRPRPQSRSWEECAAFPLASLTAYRMLRRARVAQGDTVLVVGIGSGVSAAALAIATWMGAEVHVTSRDEHKRRAALEMGAAAAHDTADERWNVRADVVIESVGPATWEKSMGSLRPGGRLVVCGGTSGSRVEINLPRLFFKQYEIIGSTMGSYEEFDEVLAMVNAGLPVSVDSVFSLAEFPLALEKLAAGAHLGKIVIRHD